MRLRQLQNLYEMVKPRVTNSSDLHDKCSSVNELEADIHSRFSKKLEELRRVQRQLLRLDELKNGYLTQLKSFMELAEGEICEDVLFELQYTSQLKELKVIIIWLLLLLYLMLVTIGLGPKIGTKVANKNQQWYPLSIYNKGKYKTNR